MGEEIMARGNPSSVHEVRRGIRTLGLRIYNWEYTRIFVLYNGILHRIISKWYVPTFRGMWRPLGAHCYCESRNNKLEFTCSRKQPQRLSISLGIDFFQGRSCLFQEKDGRGGYLLVLYSKENFAKCFSYSTETQNLNFERHYPTSDYNLTY